MFFCTFPIAMQKKIVQIPHNNSSLAVFFSLFALWRYVNVQFFSGLFNVKCKIFFFYIFSMYELLSLFTYCFCCAVTLCYSANFCTFVCQLRKKNRKMFCSCLFNVNILPIVKDQNLFPVIAMIIENEKFTELSNINLQSRRTWTKN